MITGRRLVVLTCNQNIVAKSGILNTLTVMNLTNLTSNQLMRAAKIKDQIDALNQQLNSILGGLTSGPAAKAPKGGMSAAGRARIAAAQKARWAKIHGAKGGTPAAKPAMAAKPKGTMSAAGRARIVAAQKARWAKIHAAKGGAPAAKPAMAAKPKGTMSAAGRARIVAAQKARWAKIKAAKKA
jgi:hypothetical protein